MDSRLRQHAGQAGQLRGAVRIPNVVLVQVDHQQQRLGGQELESAQRAGVAAFEFQRADGRAVLQCRQTAREDAGLAVEIAARTLLSVALDPFETALRHLQVRENQLVFHRLRIARRIDTAGCMRYVLGAEHPHDVQQCMRLAVGPHVDEAARRRGAGKIRKRHRGGHVPLRVEQRRESVEPRVGDRGCADVHFVASESSCCAVSVSAGQEAEERGLARGRESDKAGAEHVS